MNDYMRLLRANPDYARLWAAQVISLLGDWFNTIVLSALVSLYSDGSGLAVSAFLLARFVPPLLIGPFAGVLVDRFDRKRLLIVSDLARAGVVLAMLLANSPDRLWLIYVLTVAQFSLSAVFEPGRSAITPSLIRDPEDLVSANTLGSVTWSAMLAVGAIVGGAVAALFGTQIALLIDASTFVLSALLIMQIKSYTPPVRSKPYDENDSRKTKSDRGLIEGLRYVRANPPTSATLLVKLGGSLGNVDALMIVYATELFIIGEGGTTSLAIMYAAFGLGAVVGPILLNRFNDGSIRTMRRLIIVGFVFMVIAWATMGGATTLPIVALALVLRAMGGSTNWTYSSVILQKTTPDAYLGRVFSLDMFGFQLASVVSTIATGVLVDSLGVANVRVVVLGMVAVSGAVLIVWLLIVPWLERHEQPLPAATGDYTC
jgi:MFS family permease